MSAAIEGGGGDGGPAFPRPHAVGGAHGHPGMSLRDWFAGQALAGLLAGRDGTMLAESLAAQAYKGADAMLAARITPDSE